MADANTIKEFLVGLGFKIDATSERRFDDSIAKATGQVLKFGAAIEATALLVVASVARIATGMEDIYYASLRTKSSAENIRAIGYAASQTGGSVEGVRAGLESMANLIRTKPGSENLLKSLGIQTRDSKGQLRDMVVLLQEFAGKLKVMQPYKAAAYTSFFGIDLREMDALMRGSETFAADYKKMAASIGLDSNRAAVTSKNFMVSFRALGTAFDLVVTKIAVTLAPQLMVSMESLKTTLLANSDKIVRGITLFSDAVTTAATVVTHGAMRIGQFASDVIDWFDKLDPSTQKTIKSIAALTVVLRVLLPLALRLLGPIGLLAAAILALYDDYKNWKEGSEHFIDWDKWGPVLSDTYDGIKKIGAAIDGLVTSVLGDSGWKYAFEAILAYVATSWAIRIAKPILSVLGLLAMVPGSGVTAAAVSSAAAGLGLAAAVVTSQVGVAATGAAMAANEASGHGDRNAGLLATPWGLANAGGNIVRGEGGPAGWWRRNAPGWLGGAPAGADSGAVGNPNAGTANTSGMRMGEAELKQMRTYLKGEGMSDAQVAAAFGNFQGESNMNTAALGDGGRSGGLGQWNASRRRAFRQMFGHDVLQGTWQEQAKFFVHELRTSESASGNRFNRTRTVAGGVSELVHGYERPANPTRDTAIRTAYGQRWLNTFQNWDRVSNNNTTNNNVPITQTNNFNINGGSAGSSQEILNQLDRSNGDLVRNTRGATQ